MTTEIKSPAVETSIWQQTARALDAGDFSWLDDFLSRENGSIVDLLTANGEPRDYMNEAFTWTCFTGRTDDARALLDKGVDPTAGFKTGLAGFHWAANRGNLDTVTFLIDRKVPLEQKNMYGGTVLGSTLWSAVHEHREDHATIIELLIAAGAVIEDGTVDWWDAQDIPSSETKARVSTALKRAQHEK